MLRIFLQSKPVFAAYLEKRLKNLSIILRLYTVQCKETKSPPESCSASLSVHLIIALALYPQSLQRCLPALTSASFSVSKFGAAPDPAWHSRQPCLHSGVLCVQLLVCRAAHPTGTGPACPGIPSTAHACTALGVYCLANLRGLMGNFYICSGTEVLAARVGAVGGVCVETAQCLFSSNLF